MLADLLLLGDALMDSIEIEGHHRIAAGAQFDGEGIQQPKRSPNSAEMAFVSSFTLGHFVEVVLNRLDHKIFCFR